MKKRIISALLAAVMVFTLLPTAAWAAADTPFANSGGNGTAGAPYLIANLDQLEAFQKYINDGKGSGEYFKLTATIDMSSKYSAGSGTSWTPIGTDDNPFSGTFDGGGFEISGLYINTEDYYKGLFGYSTGTIKNLTVSGSVTGGTYTGGIVGENDGGSVENCCNKSAVNGVSSTSGIAGYNKGGSIENCYNTGAVTGTGNRIGGIAGNNSGSVKNCYNTGTVSGAGYVGGIVGENSGAVIVGSDSGSIENCYNTGTVSSTNTYIGGIAGSSDGSVKKCYYLNTSCTKAGNGTSKTADAFNSGEVAWLLQSNQDTPDQQVWGQKLSDGADDYPVLTSEESKKVLKVTFVTQENKAYAAKYTNPNGTVEMPETPVKDNYTFEKWAKTQNADDEEFDAETQVTEDITVYAVGRDHFGGDSADITLSRTYGYDTPITVNLDEHMKYANEDVEAAGKFTYEISDKGNTNASIESENMLSVPTGLDADDYTIKVKATEKTPQYSLMSVGSYGTADVTLTVKVGIAPAPATVTAPTAKTSLTYTGAAQELIDAGSVESAVLGCGEMQYSLDGDTYSAHIPTGEGAKTYTVYWKVDGADETNYNYVGGTSGEVEVTIAKADAIVTGSVVSVTYGQDITLTVRVAPKAANGISLASAAQNEVVFTFPKNSKTVTRTVDAAGGVVTVTIPAKEVKNYFNPGPGVNTVTVNYGGGDNLNGGASKEISVALEQKQAAFTFSAKDKTYDGTTAIEGTFSAVTGYVLEGDDVSVDSYTANTADPDAGDSKTVTVEIGSLKGQDADYYFTLPSALRASVQIFKADNTDMTAPTAQNTVYDGTEQPLVSGGGSTQGEMQYALGSASDAAGYDSAIPRARDVGTYYVWYKVVGDKNHNDTDPAKVEVTIDKAAATVTAPTAKELTYNGAAQELVTAGETADGTIEYSTDNENYSADIPTGTNADTYTVWYKVKGDKNHNDSTPQSVDVTIKKANSDVTVADSSATYGDTLTLTAEVKKSNAAGISLMSAVQDQVDFKAGETSLGTATVEYSDGELKSVGTARLTVTVDKAKYDAIKAADGKITAEYGGSVNFNESTKDNITVTLNKKTLTYTATATNRKYNGDTNVEVTLEPTNAESSDTVTLAAAGTVDDANAGNGKSVTITGVTVGGADAEYYQAAAAPTGDVTVNIEKADSTVTAPTAKADLTYTGEALELLETAGSATGGELQYKVDEGTYSTAAPKAATAGEYTVYYKVVGNDNYNGIAEASIKVTIAKATPKFPTVGDVDGGTYEPGKKLSGVTVPEVDGGTLAWSEGETALNAGENSVQAVFTPANSENYEPTSVTDTVTVNVAKATITGVAVQDVTAQFDETQPEKQYTLAAPTGTIEGDAVRYAEGDYNEANDSETDWQETCPSYSDEGTDQTITVRIERENYNPLYLTATIKITNEPAISGVDVTANDSLVYNGGAQELVTVTGASDGDTVTYYVNDDPTGSTEKATGTNAGSYSVKVKVEREGHHHFEKTVEVTIAKANSTAVVTPKDLTYTGAAQELVTGEATGGELRYSLDESAYSADIPTGTEATTYEVWYKVVGDENHEDTAAQSISVTIAKAAATVTAPTANTLLTYTGEAQALITEGSVTSDVPGSGTMRYSLTEGSGFTADIPTGEDSGTYTVYWTVDGGDETNYAYSAATSGQVTVTIAKAAATVIAPEANTPLTYTGEAQALITEGSVTSDVPGSGTMRYSLEAESGFAVDIPTGEDAGTYTVYWTVDGADETNYAYSAATSGQVTVTIAKAAAQVTMPPAARDLTYTGEEQELVTAGESNFGALVYSLDDPEGPFTEAIPTAAEAGLYTVYYMVEEADNWNASPVGDVQVEIHPADSSATVRRRTGLVYSGEAQALVTANEVTGGELVYALGEDAEIVPASGYVGRTPTAVDAGTYYVWWKILGDVDHGDTAPVCVTVTIAPFPLTFEPVAEQTPYTGAAASATVTQTAGQTPAIDPAAIAVSYEQDGAAAEPILPGIYDVLVAVTDPNFTLAGGVKRVKVGTLTITHVHVYGEEWIHDESNHWHVCQGVGACDAPRSGLAAHQLSWVDDGDGTGHQTCAVCGYTTGEHTHASDTWQGNEANRHYKICDTCGATFDRADHELTWVNDGDGTGHQTCTVCGYTTGEHAHVWDDGVVTQAPTVEAEGSRLYTCAVCGATRSEAISKPDTFQISGAVTDQAGAPLTRAAVRLTRGSDTVAETVTDDQGRYSFSSVPAGLYNVAATWEDVTKTILVELSDADASQRDIQMPNGKISSVVEVLGEDTPDVVVGGVDAIAEAEATSPAETVTVTLTVAKQEEPAGKDEIDRLVTGQKDDVLYLDVSLLKQINTQPTQAITDTGVRVLEIVVPYDFTGKRSVTVYRKHGGDPAAALTALSARPDLAEAEDGTFFADEENGWIAIYASKFSTYAIGYQAVSSGSSSVIPYVLTATAGEGGIIDPAGAIRIRRGADQSYTIRPDEGYAVADVLVDGVSVGAVTAYTFENVTAAHTIQAVFQKVGADALPFTDVAPSDWFYDSVKEVYQRGLIVGVDGSRFAPMQGATRATVVTILWRLAGSPATRADLSYADVSGDAWYAQAIRWADETGVAIGYGGGRFGPDDPITREQLALMLWRYTAAQGRDVSVGENTNILSYQDFDQIGDWAIPGLQWAVGSGVLRGTGSGATLSPKAVATRAELAAVLARYCESATAEGTKG